MHGRESPADWSTAGGGNEGGGGGRDGNFTETTSNAHRLQPTSTTTTTTTTTMNQPQTGAFSTSGFRVGIYGWRKRCLYLLILVLLLMIIINFSLTLWVLKVMEFSSEGMGGLRIVAGGVQLSGQAMILDALIASNIRSRQGQPINIESSRNFTISTRDAEGRLANRLFLGNNELECQTQGFRVTDRHGQVLFSANPQEVVVGAKELRVTGDGGAIFDGTVQTPMVRSKSGSDLRLESPTRTLQMHAPQGVLIESRGGEISASCLTDLKLQSVSGAVRLDTSDIYLRGLKTAIMSSTSPSSQTSSIRSSSSSGHMGTGSSSGSSSSTARHEVYQLCVCANGRLFLAPSQGLCSADEESGVCR